jgi:hypothetical protein
LRKLIETGDILKRREQTGAGADVHVESIPQTQPITLNVGR